MPEGSEESFSSTLQGEGGCGSTAKPASRAAWSCLFLQGETVHRRAALDLCALVTGVEAQELETFLRGPAVSSAPPSEAQVPTRATSPLLAYHQGWEAHSPATEVPSILVRKFCP